jgi:hypothetical protein
MSKVQTFKGVTQDVLEYLHAVGGRDFVTEFEADGRRGTITGASGLGRVSLHFDYDAARAEMTLTILKKPMLAPPSLLWAEFSYAVRDARKALDLPPVAQEDVRPGAEVG